MNTSKQARELQNIGYNTSKRAQANQTQNCGSGCGKSEVENCGNGCGKSQVENCGNGCGSNSKEDCGNGCGGNSKSDSAEDEHNQGCGCGCGCGCSNERKCECDMTNEELTELALRDIYKNARMGMSSVEVIKEYTVDNNFKQLLTKQFSDYSFVANEVENECQNKQIKLSDHTIFNKLMLKMNVAISTMNDKSATKLSEMMIQGINMGIISLTKFQHKLSERNLDTTFCDKLMAVFQQNLDDMKLFL